MLSLREAAEETGKTKPAILKAIKSGRISATKNQSGEWQIDPAELFRVYPRHKPENDNQPETGLRREIEGLQGEVDGLRKENRSLREDKERLVSDVEEWREQAKAARLLLTDQSTKRPEPRSPWGWVSVGAAVLILVAILVVLVLQNSPA